MKQAFILLVIDFAFCLPNTLYSQIVSIKADLLDQDCSNVFGSRYNDLQNFVAIITLTNTQDTTVRFEIMSCDWEESFITNSDSIYLTKWDCDGNFPTSINIKPHKSVKFYAKIHSKIKLFNRSIPPTFRIGFVDMPIGKLFFRAQPILRQDKSKYNVFWSDDIVLGEKLYHYVEER